MDAFDTARSELDATLKQLHDRVQAVILAATLPEKKKEEMAARPVLREARSKLSALRAETRRTAEPTTRATYEAMCRDRDEQIRNLETEMKQQVYPARSAAAARPKTFQEQREEEMMGAGGVDGTGFTSAAQVLTAATNVQADAIQSLNRAEKLQNTAEESGKQTLQTLQKQTEQMYHIDEELENLQGNLDRASRDVRWFYRQMAGDKCFLTVFGLFVLALLALVFIAVYTKRKKAAEKKKAEEGNTNMALPPVTLSAGYVWLLGGVLLNHLLF